MNKLLPFFFRNGFLYLTQKHVQCLRCKWFFFPCVLSVESLYQWRQTDFYVFVPLDCGCESLALFVSFFFGVCEKMYDNH